MPSLRQIKTKISSVTGTRRIMSAMKLISAVKLQRVQGMLLSSRPYSDSFKEVAEGIASRCERKWHPLLRKSENGGSLHVVFMTSDRGLCGSFNSSLIRKVETFLVTDGSKYDDVTFRFVGRRGRDHFLRNGVKMVDSHTGLTDRTYSEVSKAISDALIEEYSRGDMDEVLVVYNYFISALNQVITFEKLLPVEPSQGVPDDGGEGARLIDYIYEPDRVGVLDAVLPEYVKARIDRAIFETVTSEHAARMAAMDNATRNADTVVNGLTLLYNKTRQAYITTELMDIVNGTEALRKGGAE